MYNGQPTIVKLSTASGTYRAIAEIHDDLGVAGKFNQIVGEVFGLSNTVSGIRITVDRGKDDPAIAQIHVPEIDEAKILEFEDEITHSFEMTSVRFQSVSNSTPTISPRNSPFFPHEHGLRWLNGDFDSNSSVYVYTERTGSYKLQELSNLPNRVQTTDGKIHTDSLCNGTRGIDSLDPFTEYPLSLESRMGRLGAENGASIRDQLAQLVAPGDTAIFEPRWTVGQVLTFDHMDQLSLRNDTRFKKYLMELRVLCKLFGYTAPRIDVFSESSRD